VAFKLGDDEADDAGLHEINVTPFIDVMLVLLIVFMVAAPLATVNVPLDLPVSSAQAAPDPLPPVTVSLQADLTVHLGEQAVVRESLPARLADVMDGDRTRRIFLRADTSVPYGELMRLMDQLRAAGYLRVALVTRDGSAG
jgi:biopolymer transport protein ExbD/biopolymer transport protein TolR